MSVTNPLTYNGYVTQVATMAVVNTQTVDGIVSSTDPAFNTIIPQMLNYAEMRIQRDIDFLQNTARQTFAITSPTTNYVEISNAKFKTVETVNAWNYSNTEVLATLLPTTKEFIQNVYPVSYTASNWGLPKYFYLLGDYTSQLINKLYIAPQSSDYITLEVIGSSYMDSLYTYSANAAEAQSSTTYISTYLPDMLVIASMIYISAYQRNFGRQSDDPAMAQSYEAQYKALLPSALSEEGKKSFQASAWSSMSIPAIATPTR